MDNGQPLRAGQAFLETIKADSHSAAAWARIQRRLRQRLTAIRQEFAAGRAQWEDTYGESFPVTVEDWKEWLARIDTPDRFLPADNRWVGADILSFIQGYLLRLRDQKQTRDEPTREAAPPSKGNPPSTIPPGDRTIPMSYRRAAKLMGKADSQDAAEWLSRSVADGSIPCEHITRQNHVFSRQWFPQSAWPQILPK